jgi:glycosyltransferase involved in cell wall biosynthesis
MQKDSDGNMMIPSYLGVFIDSLATYVEELCLIMHESDEQDTEADYVLQGKNIKWVSLGKKTPAWHRAIFYSKILGEPLSKIKDYDVLLVRSPSPLAPYFSKFTQKGRLVYMIVGDYSEGVKNSKSVGFRERVINYFLTYNNWLFDRQIKKTDIVVNSSMLFEKYKSRSKSIHQIRTTTLSNSDFYKRQDTCSNDVIQLLYTGRIDPQKGLFELVDTTALLIQNGYDVICNIVGWESVGGDEPVKKALIARAKENNIIDKVIFHGRKTVGEELNAAYRQGDIYIIPSYHEGFPRTIWEAMANGLPVIATTVGSIPNYLDSSNSVLIQPKNSEAIYNAVVKVIEQKEFRQGIIRNGQSLARENTLEQQTLKLVEAIEYVKTT